MAGENPEHLMFVRCEPCRMRMHDPCDGDVQAHHAGHHGMGKKAHDNTAVPLCVRHHACFHSGSGPFKTFTKSERRDWEAKQIRWTRRRWIAEGEQPFGPAWAC